MTNILIKLITPDGNDVFMEVFPEEDVAPERQVYEIESSHAAEWEWKYHWKRARRRADPLGCYFLRDVLVCGDGFPFDSNMLILESSLCSRVIYERAVETNVNPNGFVRNYAEKAF